MSKLITNIIIIIYKVNQNKTSNSILIQLNNKLEIKIIKWQEKVKEKNIMFNYCNLRLIESFFMLQFYNFVLKMFSYIFLNVYNSKYHFIIYQVLIFNICAEMSKSYILDYVLIKLTWINSSYYYSSNLFYI